MITVIYMLNDEGYERGDVADLYEADAYNKLYDGIVEFWVEAEPEVMPEESSDTGKSKSKR